MYLLAAILFVVHVAKHFERWLANPRLGRRQVLISIFAVAVSIAIAQSLGA
jgi:hypothetical protein